MIKKLFTLGILFLVSIPAFAQVDTAWVRRYKGPGNGNADARAVAVDGSGNVYVTGYSVGDGTSKDYATIKYAPAGNQLWVQRYNGPGNYWDEANAITVDSSGNIYVTGWSKGTKEGYDYATIKYDPAGNQLWVQRYNGPGNSTDEAYAIAVDGSGDVYVTGYSGGSGTFYDYATVKYYPNGDTDWVRRYNGPGKNSDVASAITVDGSGNVYVTGRSWSGTSFDYATIKYDPSGNQLWVQRYNGPGNSWDYANAIALDGSGNVYVTGLSLGSGTNNDYATIKYDPAGNQIWVQRYNGPGNYIDEATAIAVDGSGNVYVTGSSANVNNASNYDYATIKYDQAGNQLWAKRYNGPGNYYDNATAIAVDGSGNVYVTGYSVSDETQYDYATIKYDTAGNQLWVQRYNGPGNYMDYALDIAVDGSGNVYVTGASCDITNYADYATIKYVQKEDTCYFTNGEYFDINSHAWGFDNSENQLWPAGSGVFPSWSIYSQAFNIIIPSPSQILYYAYLLAFHRGEWPGSCYGMAYTSQLLKDGFHKLSDFDWTDEELPINITDISGNTGARDYINSYHLYQFGVIQTEFKLLRRLQYLIFRSRPSILELRECLNAHYSAAISFFWEVPNDSTPDPNDFVTFGHSVTPICIYRESQSPEIYKILVYDNRAHTAKDCFFTVDVTNNTWTYSTFTTAERPKEMYVDVPTITQLLPLLVSKQREGQSGIGFMAPLTDSGFCLVSNGGSRGILITSSSDSIGVINNQVINTFENGAPLFLNGGIKGSAYPYAYIFPRSSIATHLGVDSLEDCNLFLFDSLLYSSITLEGSDTIGDYLIGYDTACSGYTLTSNSLSSRRLTSTLISPENTSERMFKFSEYSLNYSESLRVAFSDYDSNAVKNIVIRNRGTNKRITIEAEFFNGDSSMFRARFVNIDSNSTYHLFPCWDSLSHSDMILWIDHSGDGSIDDSVIVQNEYGTISGDANRDGKVTVSDVVYLINYLFKGGPAPNPLAVGDANCDGKVSISDIVYLINYLFKGGPAPC